MFTVGFQVDEMPTEGLKFLNLSETAPMWLVRSCLTKNDCISYPLYGVGDRFFLNTN